MPRLERFRLAIISQGYTGVVCTETPCGCDPNEDFAPCHGSNTASAIIERCRGGYKHFDPSGKTSWPVFSSKKEPLTQDEFDNAAFPF